MSSEQVASTDGVTVAVHDLGGTGPLLLLCHATGLCGRAYEPMAAALVDHFHVWALDYRGHGDTPAPANRRFDWDAMTDDLAATIDALTGEPIAVFGHSMGGATALKVEQRRPGTLRSAYLYEPIVQPGPSELPQLRNAMSEGARRRRPSFPSKAEALLRYAGRPPLGEWRADALTAYVEHGFEERDGAAWLKCAPEDEAATFEGEGKPFATSMTTVQTPTTVAAGHAGSEWSPASFAAALVDALPHARLEMHPTLGHFGPLQDPPVIAAAILAATRA